MNRKLLLTVFVLSFVLGSSAMADWYFLDTSGGNWADPCNWSIDGGPNDVNAFIGAPPNSPDGAWVTLDSGVMSTGALTIGLNGTGRLDISDTNHVSAGIYNGESIDVYTLDQIATLNINGLWNAAVGAGSVANINVSDGHINADWAGYTDPCDANTVYHSVWGTDGTVNYNQTGGWVEAAFDGIAVNAGSVVNITMTGGWLDLTGNISLVGVTVDPTAGAGELNIDLDGDAWLMITDVNTASNTNITLNGQAKLTVYGNRTAAPYLGGKLTSNGTIRRVTTSYSIITTTLFWSECTAPAAADLNADCVVDLKDLAAFVKDWLE